MTLEETRLLTPGEAAQYLGVPRSRLKKHTAAGDIAFVAVGERTKRYELAALDKFIADRRSPAKRKPASRAGDGRQRKTGRG